MKFSITTLVLLGGTLPAVLGARPRPTTTTKASTTQATPTPSACSSGPFEITSFTWFNSSSNLNCPLASDPNYLCYTGKPTQPDGYGPPDYVSFNVRNAATSRSSSCIYQNPGSVPASGEPGRAGITKCSTGDQSFVFNFVAGPSNGMGGSATADLSVADRYVTCPR